MAVVACCSPHKARAQRERYAGDKASYLFKHQAFYHHTERLAHESSTMPSLPHAAHAQRGLYAGYNRLRVPRFKTAYKEPAKGTG